MQDWEDEQAYDKAETEFQQRVLAASRGPHDPKLYWRIFDPDAVPGEETMPGAGHIIQPNSMEEFSAMIEEWDATGALAALTDLKKPEGPKTLQDLLSQPLELDPQRLESWEKNFANYDAPEDVP